MRKKNLKEKVLTEGPGAGYEIKWSVDRIDDIYISDVTFDIEERKSDGLVINANIICEIDCTVTIENASSYYYGIPHSIEELDTLITRIYLTDLAEAYNYCVENENGSYVVYSSEDPYRGLTSKSYGSYKSIDLAYDKILSLVKTEFLEYLNNSYNFIMDILEMIADNGNTFKFTFGGGWGHVTYNGELHDSQDYIDAKLLNKEVIEFINKAVLGENYYITYRVEFADGSFDYFDSEEDLKSAILNMQHTGYDEDIENIFKVQEYYDENGDIIDVDDYDEDVTDMFI